MLELLKIDNIKEIFTFEVENKSYFEKNLPPRPRGYFEMETFNEIMKEIIEEQGMGLCYMHIIRNEDNKMIGRINLSTFKNEKNELIWTLGYRIDQNANGKGYCSKAIKEVLKIAKEKYNIDKIMAGTSPENKASQRVLEKNGFKYMETIEDDFEINGVMVDTKLYSITLE